MPHLDYSVHVMSILSQHLGRNRNQRATERQIHLQVYYTFSFTRCTTGQLFVFCSGLHGVIYTNRVHRLYSIHMVLFYIHNISLKDEILSVSKLKVNIELVKVESAQWGAALLHSDKVVGADLSVALTSVSEFTWHSPNTLQMWMWLSLFVRPVTGNQAHILPIRHLNTNRKSGWMENISNLYHVSSFLGRAYQTSSINSSSHFGVHHCRTGKNYLDNLLLS